MNVSTETIDGCAGRRDLTIFPGSARRNRVYDRHFVTLLLAELRRKHARLADSPGADYARRPRTLYEFDDTFTAPVCGFGSAANYYRAALLATGRRPWLQGVFWWAWYADPDAPYIDDTDYTPQGKPAEDVLAEFWAARG